MERIDLSEITFMIPFRCDSEDRLENILLIVEYLTHHFSTTIHITENASTSMLGNHPRLNQIGAEYNKNIGRFNYTFQQNDSEIFHRTRILNDMLEDVDTKYVSNYDTDVLFPVQSYIDTLKALESGKVFVFPYLGKFYEIPRKHIPEIKEKMEVSWINLSQCGINHPNSVGGAMFFNTEIYKKLGGECELQKSWGWEDNFRVTLFQKLGYDIARVGTDLYHLAHYRGSNSGPNHEFHNDNANIYYQICGMDYVQAMKFVDSYNRFKE